MTAPLITVLITTYNYGRFIEQAIDSVLAQDFPQGNLEILVVDDGSTDDTAEHVKKYGSRGSRIEYFHKTNGGQASALNFGFARARGEIVSLLDADDLFLPGKLRSVENAFQQDPTVGMVYHPYLEWNADTNQRRESSLPLVSGNAYTDPEQFFQYYPHPTSCIAFRRTPLERFLPIPDRIRMLADAYPVNLMPFVSTVLAIPEPLTLYRIHGRNNWFLESEPAPAQRRRQLEAWQILVDAMFEWLARNRFSKKQPAIRDFRNRWASHQFRERFSADPPGRLRFFSFVVWHDHAFSRTQNWKHTTFNYLVAPLALAFGYKRARQFYDCRGRVLQALQSLLGKQEHGT